MNISKIEKVDTVLSKITIDNINHLKNYSDSDIIFFAKQFAEKYQLNSQDLYNELKQRNINLDAIGLDKYPVESGSDCEKRVKRNRVEKILEDSILFYNKTPEKYLSYNSEKTELLILLANHFLTTTYMIPDLLKKHLFEKGYSMSDIVNFDVSKQKSDDSNESLVDKITNLLRKIFPKKRINK